MNPNVNESGDGIIRKGRPSRSKPVSSAIESGELETATSNRTVADDSTVMIRRDEKCVLTSRTRIPISITALQPWQLSPKSSAAKLKTLAMRVNVGVFGRDPRANSGIPSLCPAALILKPPNLIEH